MPACHSENNYLLAIECDRITLEAILLPTGSDEKYSKIQGFGGFFLGGMEFIFCSELNIIKMFSYNIVNRNTKGGAVRRIKISSIVHHSQK
jgi:hypothetical protein